MLTLSNFVRPFETLIERLQNWTVSNRGYSRCDAASSTGPRQMTTLGKTRSYFTPCIYTSQKWTKTGRLLHVPSKIHFPLWRGIGTKPNRRTRWVNIKYFSRFWILSFSRVKNSQTHTYTRKVIFHSNQVEVARPSFQTVESWKGFQTDTLWLAGAPSVVTSLADSAIQPESNWNPLILKFELLILFRGGIWYMK